MRREEAEAQRARAREDAAALRDSLRGGAPVPAPLRAPPPPRRLTSQQLKDHKEAAARAEAARDAHFEAEAAAARAEERRQRQLATRREAEEELYARAAMLATHVGEMQFDMWHHNARLDGGRAAEGVRAWEAATRRASEWGGLL